MIQNLKKILSALRVRGNQDDGTTAWAEDQLSRLDSAKEYQKLRENEAFQSLAEVFHKKFAERLRTLVESDQELLTIREFFITLYGDEEAEKTIREEIERTLHPSLIQNLESDNS